MPVDIPYASRLKQLDRFLVETTTLWQPHPFKVYRPEWCRKHVKLCQALLELDELPLRVYANDSDAILEFISAYIPELKEIQSLIDLPTSKRRDQAEIGPHFSTGVPGRKWSQITSLYQSLENPGCGIVEWCGGKGYLGRLLNHQWQQTVTTLEYNQSLVEAGIVLADKFNVQQQFKHVDVLHELTAKYLKGHHAIALHACGDLHRDLIKGIVDSKVPGFSVVPCCYHLGREKNYIPFNCGLKLSLCRETLRLAVNETVTAHHYEIKNRDQDMAWKLGFLELRQELSGSSDYHSFKPIPKAWLKEGFHIYCQQICEREKLMLPAVVDWNKWKKKGYQRQYDVVRLQLLRQSFKRVLELWLVMDMAVYLQAHAYDVDIYEFCERSITPRNILIEGRLASYNSH